MRLLFILFFLSHTLISHAQFSQMDISFKTQYGNKTLQLNEDFVTENNDTIDISVLKFYISNIAFYPAFSSTPTLTEPKLKLLDFTNPFNSFTLQLPSAFEFDMLEFNLGLDSLTNVSGANGGDLDPTKGMYWTWQSGYINFKLEGHSKLSPARKNEFTFHLGGYSYPNLALQSVRIPITSSNKINIVLDLKKVLDQLDVSQEYKLMSPGERAVALSKIVANSFYSE